VEREQMETIGHAGRNCSAANAENTTKYATVASTQQYCIKIALEKNSLVFVQGYVADSVHA